MKVLLSSKPSNIGYPRDRGSTVKLKIIAAQQSKLDLEITDVTSEGARCEMREMYRHANT